MKRNLFVLSLMVSTFALVAGCSSDKDHGAYAPQNSAVGNLESNAHFVLLDPGAQKSVT